MRAARSAIAADTRHEIDHPVALCTDVEVDVG